MDWTKTLFDVMDLRSFSSVWFWIAVLVLHSRLGSNVLGVPLDAITRARRDGGAELDDVIADVFINIRRLRHVTAGSGTLLVGLACFLHVSLIVLGWGYGLSLAKAAELLFVPYTASVVLSIVTAQEILTTTPDAPRILDLLQRQRRRMQTIGFAALLVTGLVAISELVLIW